MHLPALIRLFPRTFSRGLAPVNDKDASRQSFPTSPSQCPAGLLSSKSPLRLHRIEKHGVWPYAHALTQGLSNATIDVHRLLSLRNRRCARAFLELLWTTSGFVKGAWCVNTMAPLHMLLAVSTRALSIAPANHSESRRYHSWYFSHPWWTALITANSSSPPWPLSSSRESSPILSKSRIIDHASRRKRFGILVHIVQPSILTP